MAEQCVTPTQEHLDPFDEIKIEGDLDFSTAHRLAWEAAEKKKSKPMMMAWYDGKSKLYSPNTSCQGFDQPAWLKYARANGSDLAVTANNRQYVFLFRGEGD